MNALTTREEQSLARLREQRRRDIETIAALEARIGVMQARIDLLTSEPPHVCERVLGNAEVAHAVRILADAFTEGGRS
jgi:hypothetical protein